MWQRSSTMILCLKYLENFETAETVITVASGQSHDGRNQSSFSGRFMEIGKSLGVIFIPLNAHKWEECLI